MKPLTALNIAVAVVAAIAFASIAPPASANDADNPYIPKPAASTETPTHGHDTYCSFGAGIPGYSCEAPKLINGEGPNKGFGGPAYANEPKPAKDECDHGPKGEGGGGGSPDGAGRSSVRS